MLCQRPPLTGWVSVVVAPIHTVEDPEITPPAIAFTVTIVVVIAVPQLVFTVYEISAVPAVIPVTTPEEDPTVATEVTPLVQVPPVVELLKVVVPLVHKLIVPVIEPTPGDAFTVTNLVANVVPQLLDTA